MAPIALFITVVATFGLLLSDRRKLFHSSWCLWLPITWLLIVGSRPVSGWIGGGGAGMTVEATLDGSPLDAAVFGVLLIAGLIVLLVRRQRTWALISANPFVVLYFVYCLASVAWSPFPGVAFKRWTKAIGDLVMVLVVLTELQPIEAIQRFFYRVGALVMPLSLFMIRYSELGRGYDPDGRLMNTGVTTNKNSLGLLTFIVGLSVVWSVWSLPRDKDEPNRRRLLLSRVALLAFVIAVLWMAQSATSIVCFVLGSALIVVSSLGLIKSRPAVFHIVMITAAVVGGAMMAFGGQEMLLSALGRDSNLTGRTEIWSIVISLARDPFFGTGFESFWNASIETVRTHPGFIYRNLNSSHNGYLDVYLNLGWVGVCLVTMVLLSGYLKACRAVHRRPEVGGLLLAFVVTAAFYSVTEAGFRMLSPAWICLLLAVVAGGTATGEFVGTDAPASPRPRTDRMSHPRSAPRFGGALPNALNRSRT